MKLKVLAGVLIVAATTAWAQVGELYNAHVEEQTTISDPAAALDAAAGDWVAFSAPALAGTRSPCCWKGKWSGFGEVGCSLETTHQSYGTRSESPLAENIIIFARADGPGLSGMRVVGEACPVDAEGATVTWIGNVDEQAGIDWLQATAVATSHDSVGDSALYALAMHRSDVASQRLYSLALKQDDDYSEEAVFWLGEARGEAGFQILKKLLAELPKGDTRREINFALTLNDSPDAADTLIQISRADADPEQRGEALFWLAEEFPDQAKDILLERLNSEQDEEVLEEAIFAISELPGTMGSQILLTLARDESKSREMRRQAIFWLANSDDDSGVEGLIELLSQ